MACRQNSTKVREEAAVPKSVAWQRLRGRMLRTAQLEEKDAPGHAKRLSTKAEGAHKAGVTKPTAAARRPEGAGGKAESEKNAQAEQADQGDVQHEELGDGQEQEHGQSENGQAESTSEEDAELRDWQSTRSRLIAIPAPAAGAAQAPILEEWSTVAIRRWMQQWQRYEVTLKAQAAQGYQVVPLPIAAMIGSKAQYYIEEILCDGKGIYEMEEDDILAFMEEAIGADNESWKTMIVERIFHMLKEQLLQRGAMAPVDQIRYIFMDAGFNLREYGIDMKDIPVHWATSQIVAMLRPAEFREYVSKARNMSTRFPTDSLMAVRAHLEGLAMEMQTAMRIYRRPTPAIAQGVRHHQDSAARRQDERVKGSEPKGRRYEPQHRTQGSRRDDVRERRKPIACFQCGTEGHAVRNCPSLAGAERRDRIRELEQQGKLKRRGEREGVAKIGVGMDRENLLELGVLRECSVLGVDGFVCALDSFATVSVMGQDQLRRILDRADAAELVQLDPPVEVHGFAKKVQRVRCQQMLRNVDMLVSTPTGDVEVSDVQFLIAPMDMETVIVGIPELARLGALPGRILDGLGKQQQEVLGGPEECVCAVMDDDCAKEESLVPGELTVAVTRTSEEELELAQAMAAMFGRARKAGLPAEQAERLQKELAAVNVWRTRLGQDPPARIPAFTVKLKPGVQPFRAKARRYSHEQSQAIAKEIAEMERAGLVKRNLTTSWANPVMALPKPGGRGWRLVVDLVQTNRRCEPRASTLPLMDGQWEALAGSRCFATLDLHKGFWQVALEEHSQEYFSIITDRGVYTPTRLMMGATDASSHFQQGVADVLGDLFGEGGALLWIDDILVHAANEQELADRLARVIRRLDDAGLKTDPRKCELFARQIRWFGKIIGADGIKPDPERVRALTAMKKPTRICELQQFLGAVGWMRSSIPDYAQVVSPLQQVLREGLQRAPKARGKSTMQLVDVGWGEDQNRAFSSVLDALQRAVALAIPDPAKELALFTDASDKFWSAVVVQYAPQEKLKDLGDRDMQPLAFISGAFVGAAARWGICDKEAFPIIAAVTKLDYLLQRAKPFTILTDHRNLMYIMSPEGSCAKRATIDRVHRWALQLRPYNYVVEHIDGARNLWADLLSRWARSDGKGAPETVTMQSVCAVSTSGPGYATGYLTTSEELQWPDLQEIRRQQRDVLRQPAGAIAEQIGTDLQWDANKRLWVHAQNGRTWIPTRELRLRVMVIAHAGWAGHRGERVTVDDVQQWCWWPGLRKDVREFVRSCLHCRSNKGPRAFPRPLGEALRGTSRNEVLHMDFLYMGAAADGSRYLLVLKDGFTGYTELVPCVSPTALVAAQALAAWAARYGAPKMLVSDRASHFMNEMLREVTRVLGVGHHFTVAYSPWSNGTVERVNRDILALARVKLSEARLPVKVWPQLVPAITHAINNHPGERRDGIAPVTAFCGMERSNPVQMLMTIDSGQDDGEKEVAVYELDDSAKVAAATEKLVRSLRTMHQRIVDARRREQAARLARTDPTARRQHANFDVGDYVLYTAVSNDRGKLQARKLGPARIVTVKSEWVYEVEDLITGRTEDMHAQRLEFYADHRLHISEELKEHIRYNQRAYEVDRLLDVRLDGEWQALVKWAGFSREEATWQSLDVLAEDVPELVEQLLDRQDISDACRRFVERKLAK